MNNRTQKNAFTLLEIMIVIVIVGALATVAFVNYSGVMERQKAEEGKHIIQMLFRAQKVYAIDNGNFTDDLTKLDITVSGAKYFLTPAVSNPADPVTNPIATIARIGNRYTLGINSGGTISCGYSNDGCNAIGMPCSFTCPISAQ